MSKLSQGLFYITALAIMQDFRDNEKKQLKTPPAPHSTLIIEKYSTVTKFLCKPRENVM